MAPEQCNSELSREPAQATHDRRPFSAHENDIHITDFGYSDRERLKNHSPYINVPKIMMEPSRCVGRAFEIIHESLYPKPEAENHELFLSLSDLEHIFSCEFIGELLKHHQTIGTINEPLPAMEDICGSDFGSRRLQILATLVLISKVELITTFIELKIFDDSLPLAENSQVFTEWKKRTDTSEYAINFREKQYRVLAPFFNFSQDQARHYVFPENSVMPFMDPCIALGRGKDGMVFKTRIHPDHQYSSSGQICEVAIKRFIAAEELYKMEEIALKKFCGPNEGHDHLIRLLLSYQIGSRRYMIFPLAEKSLRQHWASTCSNIESHEDLTWLTGQCLGIAQGLQKIHRYGGGSSPLSSIDAEAEPEPSNKYCGRHGDIKPDNILCFNEHDSERCRLVIADFTHMRFHSDATVYQSYAGRTAHTLAYKPPEFEHSTARVSPKCDIWTLGCVYLEFITWYLLGYHAVYGDEFIEEETGGVLEAFESIRENDNGHFPKNSFFIWIGDEPQLKETVKKWINFLHTNKCASQPVHIFLDLIENSMLVPQHEKRASIGIICQELEKIHNLCGPKNSNCHLGNPLPRMDKTFPPIAKQKRPYHGPFSTVSELNDPPNSLENVRNPLPANLSTTTKLDGNPSPSSMLKDGINVEDKAYSVIESGSPKNKVITADGAMTAGGYPHKRRKSIVLSSGRNAATNITPEDNNASIRLSTGLASTQPIETSNGHLIKGSKCVTSKTLRNQLRRLLIYLGKALIKLATKM